MQNNSRIDMEKERQRNKMMVLMMTGLMIFLLITALGIYFVFKFSAASISSEKETTDVVASETLETDQIEELLNITDPDEMNQVDTSSTETTMTELDLLYSTKLKDDYMAIAEAQTTYLKQMENSALINFEGYPYSQQLQRILSLNDIITGRTLQLNMQPNHYTLMIDSEGKMVLAYTHHESIVLISKLNYQVHDSMDLAKANLSDGMDFTFATGKELKRGSEDRKAIADVVKTYNGEKELMYIRHLVSDDTWAYLIGSNYSTSQKVDQYILKKTDGNWTVMKKFFGSYNIATTVQEDVPGFNFLLLPDFTPATFNVDYLNNEEIKTITAALNKRGSISGYPKTKYITGIDRYLYILFSDGQRVFVILDEYKSDKITEVLSIDGKSSKYHYLLIQYTDGQQLPYHVFLQE